MIRFLIKFLNISTIVFLINIFTFDILSRIYSIELTLIITLVLIFFLNFTFIIYSFDIRKNRLQFLIGLMILSLIFRFFEYVLFIKISHLSDNMTLIWFFTISTSFFLKIFVYKIYFNLKFFKNLNQKKKIFIFSPDIKGGGAEKNVLLITKLLDPKLFDISLILWKKNNLKLTNCDKILIDKKNLKSSFFKVLVLIIKKNPDYIFSSLNHMSIFLGIILVFSGTKSKHIIRESNFLSLKLKDEHQNIRLKRFLRKIFTYLTYNNCDKVICPSKEIYKDLNYYFKIRKKKLIVIPNLIEKSKIFSKKINLTKSGYLLGIGRLELQKDFEFMIKSFKESLKFKNNKLLIIGSGSQKLKLNQMIKKLNLQKKIKIINFQKNLSKFFINSKSVLMTSEYEGMPNVILEASSFGIKCLITNFPGSSFFKNFKNVIISKKIIGEYAKQISKLDNKRKLPEKFLNDLMINSEKKFQKCFK